MNHRENRASGRPSKSLIEMSSFAFGKSQSNEAEVSTCGPLNSPQCVGTELFGRAASTVRSSLPAVSQTVTVVNSFK